MEDCTVDYLQGLKGNWMMFCKIRFMVIMSARGIITGYRSSSWVWRMMCSMYSRISFSTFIKRALACGRFVTGAG